MYALKKSISKFKIFSVFLMYKSKGIPESVAQLSITTIINVVINVTITTRARRVLQATHRTIDSESS